VWWLVMSLLSYARPLPPLLSACYAPAVAARTPGTSAQCANIRTSSSLTGAWKQEGTASFANDLIGPRVGQLATLPPSSCRPGAAQ